MAITPEDKIKQKEIEEIKKELRKAKPKDGFDAKRFNGIMPFLEDGMEIQRKLRAEWDRNIGIE